MYPPCRTRVGSTSCEPSFPLWKTPLDHGRNRMHLVRGCAQTCSPSFPRDFIGSCRPTFPRYSFIITIPGQVAPPRCASTSIQIFLYQFRVHTSNRIEQDIGIYENGGNLEFSFPSSPFFDRLSARFSYHVFYFSSDFFVPPFRPENSALRSAYCRARVLWILRGESLRFSLISRYALGILS